MTDYPTPEELGEKLTAGEITKEEAVEIMAQRARADAMTSLYSPAAGEADEDGAGTAEGDSGPCCCCGRGVGIVVVVVVVLALLWFLFQRL